MSTRMLCMVQTCLLIVYWGLPFCLNSLCLTQLEQKFGNGLSAPLHFPEADIRPPKWGKPQENIMQIQCHVALYPQEILAIFPKKNQHKFNTIHCISSRGRGLKKHRACSTCKSLCSTSQCGRKTFIMSAHSTLLPWPPIPHLNWALNSH